MSCSLDLMGEDVAAVTVVETRGVGALCIYDYMVAMQGDPIVLKLNSGSSQINVIVFHVFGSRLVGVLRWTYGRFY
jgi:hypothetical protein